MQPSLALVQYLREIIAGIRRGTKFFFSFHGMMRNVSNALYTISVHKSCSASFLRPVFITRPWHTNIFVYNMHYTRFDSTALRHFCIVQYMQYIKAYDERFHILFVWAGAYARSQLTHEYSTLISILLITKHFECICVIKRTVTVELLLRLFILYMLFFTARIPHKQTRTKNKYLDKCGMTDGVADRGGRYEDTTKYYFTKLNHEKASWAIFNIIMNRSLSLFFSPFSRCVCTCSIS